MERGYTCDRNNNVSGISIIPNGVNTNMEKKSKHTSEHKKNKKNNGNKGRIPETKLQI